MKLHLFWLVAPSPLVLVVVVICCLAVGNRHIHLADGDVIKIGLLGVYTNDSSTYIGSASVDFEMHGGIWAALLEGVADGRLPDGDTIELVIRNVPDAPDSASAQAADLIFNEEVLAIAGASLNAAPSAFAVGNTTSPATPMVGGLGADPNTFFGANALHAINYRVSVAEEAMQMLNLAINSKMRCKKFAVVYNYETSIAAIGKGLLEVLAERGFTSVTEISYGSLGLNSTEEGKRVADYVMGGAGNGVASCILNIGDAEFTLNLALEVAAHEDYILGETYLISSSVSNLARLEYDQSIGGLAYTIQQLPYYQDTTWQIVKKYKAARIVSNYAVNRFSTKHNVTTLPNSNETVNIYTADKVQISYASFEGYLVGRMLLEIFSQMQKPYTRQGIMDAVYGSGFFKLDDLFVGPYSSGCVGKRASEGSTTACVCNQGNKVLHASYLNEAGRLLAVAADSAFLEHASIGRNEMDLGACAFDISNVNTPLMFLIPVDTNYTTSIYNATGQVFQGSLEEYIAESTEYYDMMVQTMASFTTSGLLGTSKSMVPLLEARENYTDAVIYGLLERYRVMAIVGGAHQVESPHTSVILLDPESHGIYQLEDPHVLDFDRNHLRTNPVLADYITTTVQHFYSELSERKGKPYAVLILTETAEELAIVRKALWTEQMSDFSERVITDLPAGTTVDAWLEANYGSSVVMEADATVVIFMASQYGTSVNATIAFAAAHSNTVELHLATGEEFIDAAVGSLSAETKAAWGSNNIFFASNVGAFWAPDLTSDQTLLGNFYTLLGSVAQPTWSKLRAYRMSVFLLQAQGAIYGTITSQAFVNIWYSQGSITSFGDDSLGPFYDAKCTAEVNASNSVDRTCQCGKGPRRFFVHSARDWALDVSFANLSSAYSFTMTTCGVRYEALAVTPLGEIGQYVIGGIAAAGLISISLGLIICLRPKKRDLSTAPKDQTKPFAMVFTDIQSSTNLWARLPEKMGEAVDAHHAIIRGLIKKHKGYEVKTIGDSFMVAFTKTQSAIEFGVNLQSEFYNYDWGHCDIDDVYRQLAEEKLAEAEEEEAMGSSQATLAAGITSLTSVGSTSFETQVLYKSIVSVGRSTGSASRDATQLLQHVSDPAVWNGLRVRVAVHYGFGEIKFDQVSLGYDYYGTVVNTAARVEGVGNGGQVLVTGPAYDDVTKGTHEVPIPDISSSNMGPQPLRGLDEPVVLHQVLPAGLAERQFAPLRLDVEREIETEDETTGTERTDGSGNLITPEIMAERYARRAKGDLHYHGTHQQLVFTYNVTKAVFSTSTDKKKKEMLEHWAQKWRVVLDHNKSLPFKTQFDRHLMQLLIKVTPTVDAARRTTNHATYGSQGSRASSTSRGRIFGSQPSHKSDTKLDSHTKRNSDSLPKRNNSDRGADAVETISTPPRSRRPTSIPTTPSYGLEQKGDMATADTVALILDGGDMPGIGLAKYELHSPRSSDVGE